MNNGSLIARDFKGEARAAAFREGDILAGDDRAILGEFERASCGFRIRRAGHLHENLPAASRRPPRVAGDDAVIRRRGIGLLKINFERQFEIGPRRKIAV